MSIEHDIRGLYGLSRCDAGQLGDQILDSLIGALMRDPSLPTRASLHWAVALANVRQQVVEHIHDVIDDYVARDDVLNELCDHDLLDLEGSY
jgi:hypothetical protein